MPRVFALAGCDNKTPYELFNGRSSAIGFLRPFGCHVMILNTLDHLGKFDAKGDEGISSTNISGTKEDALKENVSSLRYIALPNWFHEAQMATSNDSTRNRDAFSEKVETKVPTISTPVPTVRVTFHMDWLSKRNFVIVCHEKVVRIPLEGDEILQVHGERTQGVVKTLMDTKRRWGRN
ncbi:hypothetical protein Tco_0605679 [Tanacetum coccineum]